MIARHEKAATPASLATGGAAAKTIGDKAKRQLFDSTIAAARATSINSYAVQIIAARYQLSYPVAQCVAELAAIGVVA
jgi:hypothetical protein